MAEERRDALGHDEPESARHQAQDRVAAAAERERQAVDEEALAGRLFQEARGDAQRAYAEQERQRPD